MSLCSISPPMIEEEPPMDGDGDGKDDIKARSANIYADPKMRELKHYMRSHQHEVRLRESAELEKRPPSSGKSRNVLRAEGCEVMDEQLKKLSKEEAVVPYVAKSGELPEAFRERTMKKGDLKDSMENRLALLRRMDKFQTRLDWRQSMDHSLKRLLVDLDLSRDERLKEYEVKRDQGAVRPSASGAMTAADVESQLQHHWQKTCVAQPEVQEEVNTLEAEIQKTRFAKARCEHLDKIFTWYEIQGMKEARKERVAPPYLRYNPQHPVMPGSLRVAPPLRELLNKTGKSSDGGMGHSSSSPALLAAGAAATGSSSAPPADMGA